MQKLSRRKQRKRLAKKLDLFLQNVWTFSLLWYVVVLTGGATYEKYDKRAMARKHNTARGQPNQLQGNKGTPRLYVTASRGSRKELHGRAERNVRKVPRLLERVYEPRRSSHL